MLQLGGLGPYRFEGLLGTGGMGVVIRARGPEGEAVAIKAIQPSLIDPKHLARFEREASIRIEHPNVIRQLDVGTEAGIPYIVFELLEGRSLHERLEAGGLLSPEESIRLGIEVCRGLEAAHAAGVIHRDLKPGNLFLCEDGRIKLLDFGIALVNEASRLTRDTPVLGTLSYLSPEQACGRELDPRADLWALGVVLFESLCGRLPFHAGNTVALLVAIINNPPLSLRELRPDLPEALVAIIERCLAKPKKERWSSAASLREALESLEGLEGEALEKAATPKGRLLPLTAEESRVVVALLARGATGTVATVEGIIRQHGGVPLSLLGRDVVGLFGLEAWLGDEARRAVSAAIALRHLAEGVAVSSGHAQVDGEGIAGEALEKAERACVPLLYGIAVDTSTASSLGDALITQPGPEGFVEALALGGAEEEGFGEQAPAPMVGRGEEREALEEACRVTSSVLLHGPAGIGKSRLCREAERLFAARWPRGITLASRAEPFSRDASFGLFASALRRRAHRGAATRRWPPIDPGAPPMVRQQAVLALAREAFPRGEEAVACAPFLAELLGVPWPPNAELLAARSDAQLMADRLRLALVDYLEGLLARGPLALILEDLQWADRASLSLLAGLPLAATSGEGEEEAALPLFAVLTARERSTLLSYARPGVREVELGGLRADEVRRLAEEGFGVALSEEAARTLCERTEGNPLLVEQIVLALKDRGRWAPEDLEELLPFGVEATVQSRLDQLPPSARALCRAASIYGRAVQREELRALVDAELEPEVEADLSLLMERGLMDVAYGGRSAGTIEHRFRSTLVGQVAYRSVAAKARATLHARAAEHLEESPDRDAEEIALHYEKSGRSQEAALRFAEAAGEAAIRGDSDRVLRCSRRALELGIPGALAFALHIARADTYRYLRRPKDQETELGAALGTAARPADRARARTERATIAARAGHIEEAVALSLEAIKEADQSEDVAIRTIARARLARILTLRGKVERAGRWIREAEQIAATGGPLLRGLVAEAHAFMASNRGDLGRALEGFAEAARLFRLAGDDRRAIGNDGNLADFYNRVGDHAAAEAALKDALLGCRRVGNTLYEGYVLLNLGYAIARQGRIEEALSLFDASEAASKEMNDARLESCVHLYRALAQERGGDPAQAGVEGRIALAKAKSSGNVIFIPTAEALLARLALAAGDLEAALSSSERALEALEGPEGVSEDVAEIYLTRASALEAAGDREGAAEVRRRGARRLLRMASEISDPAWRETFLHQVEDHAALLSEPPHPP